MQAGQAGIWSWNKTLTGERLGSYKEVDCATNGAVSPAGRLSPRAYGPRNLMKVAGVATKWKRNVAATQALNPLLSVALSRLSTLLVVWCTLGAL